MVSDDDSSDEEEYVPAAFRTSPGKSSGGSSFKGERRSPGKTSGPFSPTSPGATWKVEQARDITGSRSKYTYEIGKDHHTHRGPPYLLNNSTAVFNR